VRSDVSLRDRIDAATPAGRDRGIDALRAIAILGVVLGHWLVTAVVDEGGGRLSTESPLTNMPEFVPISWLLQSLAVFFLVGGYAAARSWRSAEARGATYGGWLGQRLMRLFAPVALLLIVWAIALAILVVAGTPYTTLRTLVLLVVSPLWFLMVFAGITSFTPLLSRNAGKRAIPAAVFALAAVAGVDAVRFALDGPHGLGWINVIAGWLVPFSLGVAWAEGAFRERKLPWALFAGGFIGAISLVAWFGYPASMVGVPGVRTSNLNPPTLAAVSFGLAQCGSALLVHPWLRRRMQSPAVWAAVATANLSAITVFMWHQSALLTVMLGARWIGPLPGLHTRPDSPAWVLQRLAWLPVFATMLLLLWSVARKAGAVGSGPGGTKPKPIP
jgi:peptidoglycan/LPS O-acetylase OafA/YrhL